jgi:hypothetical protein
MLIFIVLYAYATGMWLVIKLLNGFIEEKPRPVLTALTFGLLWPLITVMYVWIGIKMFARHMLEEFTSV